MNSSDVILCNQEKIKNLLDLFAKEVKNKKYNKVPYNVWQKISKSNFIKLTFCKSSIAITFNDIDKISLPVKDKSLGEFIKNKFFNESEDKEKVAFDRYETAFELNSDSSIATTAIDSICNIGKTAYTIGNCYADLGTAINSGSLNISYDSDSIYNTVKRIETDLTSLNAILNSETNKIDYENSKKEKKENNMLKGMNLNFGSCNENIRLSAYGMAVKNSAGEWVSYNKNTNEIVNVEIFNIKDGEKYIYKIPVAITDIKIGDTVFHNNIPMFVTDINKGETFEVIDVYAGESKNIIPTKNVFGFNFMIKAINLFECFSSNPTSDQPFGNMLPLFLMSDSANKDFDPMMMFIMMQQQNQNNDFSNIFDNPMMLYMLMKDDKNFNPMVLFALNGLQLKNKNICSHNCKCDCEIE